MSEFLITIKTALENAGIKATDEQLSKLQADFEKTGQVGKESGDKTSAALGEAGKAGEEAGHKIHEGGEHGALGHRELHEAVRAVSQQFGGLADVGLWLNPMTAGLAAVLFLLDKIKEKIGEVDEAAAEVATQSAAINTAKLKSYAEAASAAATAINQLAIEQEKLNTAYANGDTAMENRIHQYAAEKDAIMEVEAAKQQAFEAEIKRAVALGRITKEHGDALIEDSKLQLEAMRGASNQAKLQEEIEERKKQLAQARTRLSSGSDQSGLTSAQEAATRQAGVAGEAKEKAEQAEKGKFLQTYTDWSGHQANFNGTTEELKKKIQEQRDTQQEQEEQGHGAIAERYKHDADELQSILDRQNKYIENLKTIAQLENARLDTAKGHVDTAKDQLGHDLELDRTGQDRIATLQAQYELQRRTQSAVQQQHRRAADYNEDTENIEAAQRTAARVQSGHGTPQENQQADDLQRQQRTARERGPMAGLDAADVIATGRTAANNARGQALSPAALAEIHQILQDIIGFQSNTENSVQHQARELAETRRRLQDLESTHDTNRIGGSN